MKVIIAGSRHINERRIIERALCHYPGLDNLSEIVHGGCRGVDTLAGQWASDHGVKVTCFPADWVTEGKRAGPIRNAKMAAYADALLAIWDGKSLGTLDMINQMVALGKPVWVSMIPEQESE